MSIIFFQSFKSIEVKLEKREHLKFLSLSLAGRERHSKKIIKEKRVKRKTIRKKKFSNKRHTDK